MALRVKHLNADATFLLTFTPGIAPTNASTSFPGSFTILCDPWLTGSSSILSPRFQISHHTSHSCISSLSELPLPDLILVSQNKPDHCHRQTLCSLPADTHVQIVAEPAAAKTIRSWKHFHNADIQSLRPYSSKDHSSLLRFPIPAYTASGSPGEVTIAFMADALDVTGLHNAIVITYRPPGTTLVNIHGDRISLPALSPPLSRDSSRSPLRSDSPMSGQTTPPQPLSPSSSTSSTSDIESPISVMFAPHGASSATISPFIESYLRPQRALPLTALFHCINIERNPWFMGGLVANGLPGGLNILRLAGAKHWISTHDEVKDNRGLATVLIKSQHYTIAEAQDKIDQQIRTWSEEQPHRKTRRRKDKQGYSKDVPRTRLWEIPVGDTLRVQ